ncbi:hypothetical protein [Novosphingobium jiangmenense]|uniref:Uncharacterized protein n=1 Tax=Novosphingobium jiangmenense TaxID=2791981 RepID=A0ABS0HH80_9SPHN|nr:hypothetical protein [Novosphingobium jiangmenense]MBF9151513.1 hypothetical protein [Novosphingobium jiangmenense]
MVSGRTTLAALMVIGFLGAAGSVQASQGTASITITGQVPLVCRVSVDDSASAMMSANGNRSVLREFCNNGAGYRVVASYSKQLSAGQLVVDGQPIALDGSGEVVISDVSHAASTARTIAVSGSDKVAGSIRFRIEPR